MEVGESKARLSTMAKMRRYASVGSDIRSILLEVLSMEAELSSAWLAMLQVKDVVGGNFLAKRCLLSGKIR